MVLRPNLPRQSKNSSLAPNVTAAIFCCTCLNTARRFAYPFASVLSRGLGVPLTAITTLIATNETPSVLGVFFGPAIDRLGYRRIMLAALGLLSAGMLSAGLFPLYWMVWTAFLLAGFGKSLFDPAVQAYASQQVPYGRRGMVIGLLEFSWAGSALIGIPTMGILIDRMGWHAPFLALGGLGLAGLATLALLIPADAAGLRKHARPDMGRRWQTLFVERAALGAIGFGYFISMGNDNLFVVYGAWLEKSFGLSVTAIGLGTTVIGIAEFAGEGLTALFSDRWGLKRSVFSGVVISTVCYAVFPFLAMNLTLALLALFFVFLSFEFTIVASISLCTELLPESRGTMMATFMAAAGAGRVIGALTGGAIWVSGGIPSTIAVSVICNAFAFLSMFWGLHRWHRV